MSLFKSRRGIGLTGSEALPSVGGENGLKQQLKASNILRAQLAGKVGLYQREADLMLEKLRQEQKNLLKCKELTQQRKHFMDKKQNKNKTETKSEKAKIQAIKAETEDLPKNSEKLSEETKRTSSEELVNIGHNAPLNHKQDMTLVSVSSMERSSSNVTPSSNSSYKRRPWKLVQKEGSPLSVERLSELAKPSYQGRLKAFLSRRRGPRQAPAMWPRSYCQLRSLDQKQYDLLMQRVPTSNDVQLNQQLLQIQQDIQEERKRKKQEHRNQVPMPVVLPEFSQLSRGLGSCRYLYTYDGTS